MWDSEQSYDFISNKLIHGSFMIFDNFGRLEFDLTHQLLHFFRVNLLIHRSVVGEIGKQDSRLTALPEELKNNIFRRF